MKKSSMPNTGKSGGVKAGGTNTGKTGGLRSEKGSGQGIMNKPSTKNPYPNGLS